MQVPQAWEQASHYATFHDLWYGELNAIADAKHYSRSHDAVIRVYDEAGNVIETHEHGGDFTHPCEAGNVIATHEHKGEFREW